MDPCKDPFYGSLYGSYMIPLWIIYLYDHPAGDKEIGGGERRPEEGSHHEVKNNAENKTLNRFEITSFNGIRGVF